MTTLCLSFFSGIIAMLGAWDSVNMFGYISVAIIMYGAALPGYVDGAVYWNYVSRRVEGYKGWGKPYTQAEACG